MEMIEAEITDTVQMEDKIAGGSQECLGRCTGNRTLGSKNNRWPTALQRFLFQHKDLEVGLSPEGTGQKFRLHSC